GPREQFAQVDGGCPAGVVPAVATPRHSLQPAPELAELLQHLQHLALVADNAREVLHLLLQLMLERERVLPSARPLEARQYAAFELLQPRWIQGGQRVLPGVLCRIFAGPLAEHQ